MPMDVDYIAGKQALDSLYKLLSSIPHGEREAIADDIIEMEEKLQEKYKKEQDETI